MHVYTALQSSVYVLCVNLCVRVSVCACVRVCVCVCVTALSMCYHLVMVERLACSSEPQSDVIWSLVLLVGSPLVNRSVVRI